MIDGHKTHLRAACATHDLLVGWDAFGEPWWCRTVLRAKHLIAEGLRGQSRRDGLARLRQSAYIREWVVAGIDRHEHRREGIM